MNYLMMVPPFEMKPFEEMNKEEAKQHFNWFISEIPNRINYLKSFYEYTGGGKQEQLDFSVESLRLLWSWFLPFIKTEKLTEEKIKKKTDQLPKWVIEFTKLPGLFSL